MAKGAESLRQHFRRGLGLVLVVSLAWTVSCSKNSGNPPPGIQCTVALTGTPWVPNVPSANPSNHDATATLTQTTLTSSATLMGLADSGAQYHETASIPIDMTTDLGAFGSLSLTAQVTSLPSGVPGSAFAVLVSLLDSNGQDYVHLNAACAANGFYTCAGASCTPNAACGPQTPSAFLDRVHWEQHQVPGVSGANSPSINIFPSCNWASGTVGDQTFPGCPFVSAPSWFTAGKLPTGIYHAKYAILSDSLATVSSPQTAGISVTVTKKTDATASVGGALDVNFILVGTHTIQASRSAKGGQNLNTVGEQLAAHLNQAGTGIKLGTVRAVEWPCAQSGDTFADVGVTQVGSMFVTAASILPATATSAINVFFVSSITNDTGGNPGLTFLGLDGAIGGPLVNGTTESGMTVSTFDGLATLNPNCSASATVCPATSWEPGFFDLQETVAHETGHFLGLNHPSESGGTIHDLVDDTPICTATESVAGTNAITVNSCLTIDSNTDQTTTFKCSDTCTSYNSATGLYCPAAVECQFNYMMWWTTKNFSPGPGTSDGLLYSPHESAVMNYHPIVQ